MYILESWAEVNRHVLVPLLEAAVLLDVVKVFTTDHYRPLHLHPEHHTRQDTATDADVASKWAFLVNVCSHQSLRH